MAAGDNVAAPRGCAGACDLMWGHAACPHRHVHPPRLEQRILPAPESVEQRAYGYHHLLRRASVVSRCQPKTLRQLLPQHAAREGCTTQRTTQRTAQGLLGKASKHFVHSTLGLRRRVMADGGTGPTPVFTPTTGSSASCGTAFSR